MLRLLAFFLVNFLAIPHGAIRHFDELAGRMAQPLSSEEREKELIRYRLPSALARGLRLISGRFR